MGTGELANIVAENILSSDILLLENHGIIATGTNLLQAFEKIEVLENAAKMTLIVELSKKKTPLGKSRILEIEKLFR
jgi:L-fuculose-phosphate aldolase